MTDWKEVERKRRENADRATENSPAATAGATPDDEALRARIEAQHRAAAEANPWKKVALDKAAPRTYPLRIQEVDHAIEAKAETSHLSEPELKARVDALHRAVAEVQQRELRERRARAEITSRTESSRIVAESADRQVRSAAELVRKPGLAMPHQHSSSAAEPAQRARMSWQTLIAVSLLATLAGFAAAYWLSAAPPGTLVPATAAVAPAPIHQVPAAVVPVPVGPAPADMEPSRLHLDDTLSLPNEPVPIAKPATVKPLP